MKTFSDLTEDREILCSRWQCLLWSPGLIFKECRISHQKSLLQRQLFQTQILIILPTVQKLQNRLMEWLNKLLVWYDRYWGSLNFIKAGSASDSKTIINVFYKLLQTPIAILGFFIVYKHDGSVPIKMRSRITDVTSKMLFEEYKLIFKNACWTDSISFRSLTTFRYKSMSLNKTLTQMFCLSFHR